MNLTQKDREEAKRKAKDHWDTMKKVIELEGKTYEEWLNRKPPYRMTGILDYVKQ